MRYKYVIPKEHAYFNNSEMACSIARLEESAVGVHNLYIYSADYRRVLNQTDFRRSTGEYLLPFMYVEVL